MEYNLKKNTYLIGYTCLFYKPIVYQPIFTQNIFLSGARVLSNHVEGIISIQGKAQEIKYLHYNS